jgi:hypothetical protein
MRERSESHKGIRTESCGNTEEELRKFEQISAKTVRRQREKSEFLHHDDSYDCGPPGSV